MNVLNVGKLRLFRLVSLGLLALSLAATGCSGCDSDTGEGGLNPTDDVGADSRDEDVATDDAGGGESDATDAGPDTGQTPTCPPYQSWCDGECIPTSTDPDNCGSCGIVCSDGQACSGGVCSDGCMPGLTVCGRQCIQLGSDNDHCGVCGNACADGQGCVDGTCQQAADLGDRASACAGGGPAIDLGSTVVTNRQCTGQLAEQTFRWALCSCDGISATGDIVADAYDSQIGPYIPGGEGGGLATNGGISGTSGVRTTGTLWASGMGMTGDAMAFNAPPVVGQRLYANGSVRATQGIDVSADAYVNGDLSSTSASVIGGTLYVPQDANVSASVSSADVVRGPVDVPPPCGECDPADRIPVADIVAAHSADANDNAAIGLDPDILMNGNDGPRRIDLPCGSFYLSGISINEEATIVAHGNTALFIGGDIDATQRLTITLTPDAQLDVFVAGSVTTNTGLHLGSPNYPALFRMYVGGGDGFQSTNGARIGGYLYAVPGGVRSTTRSEVFGGVYGQTFETTGGSELHFDRHVTLVGEACPGESPLPDPGEGFCGTETDDCETSNDCCSPLICNGEKRCALLQCQPLSAPCTEDEECCTGVCGGGICVGG